MPSTKKSVPLSSLAKSIDCMSSTLYYFTDDTYIKIFRDYLTIPELSKYDIAINNRYLRDRFLSIISKREVVFTLNRKLLINGISPMCLRWLWTRNIHINTLALSKDVTEIYLQLFPLKYSTIKKWIIPEFYDASEEGNKQFLI
jgi:hypothetical protein